MMNETQLHEPMSDWRQPDEDEKDDEVESVHHRAAWEKKRRWKTTSDKQEVDVKVWCQMFDRKVVYNISYEISYLYLITNVSLS